MSQMQALVEKLKKESATDHEKVGVAKLRALVYLRVSTQKQDDKGLSLPQQQLEVQAYAERTGIEIVEEYQEATSAYQHEEKRSEFHRMVVRAKSDPSINIILIHEYSRFSRNLANAMTVCAELKASGVRLLSATEPEYDFETLPGVCMGTFTHASNQETSRKISEHVKKGCRANIRTRDEETGLCYKNGGKALWGYSVKLLERGVGKGGRPEYKQVWELDDTIVAGKPVHEWVRYCLVELAMKGASQAKLRDFCNEQGIPGRSDKIWNSTSWKDLLYDFNILKYAGCGVWNVRDARTRKKPIEEWEIVEDAHPSIITKEEATALIDVRQKLRKQYHGPAGGRARKSKFLLSGGSAVCLRCGKNLIGHKKYYVCGSQPYRSGLGCGEGVYVPQLLLESEVIKDIEEIIAKLADPKQFTKKVNEELRRMWEQHSGYDPEAEKHINGIDRKIKHIRQQLEDGLDDTVYFNGRLKELTAEREGLEASLTACDKPMQVDAAKVMAYRTDLDNILKQSELAERKEYVQAWVDHITLDPDAREVFIQYRIPNELTNLPIMNTSSPEMHFPGFPFK